MKVLSLALLIAATLPAFAQAQDITACGAYGQMRIERADEAQKVSAELESKMRLDTASALVNGRSEEVTQLQSRLEKLNAEIADLDQALREKGCE